MKHRGWILSWFPGARCRARRTRASLALYNLEDRLAPATLSANLDVGGNLVISDTDPLGKANSLSISFSGGNYLVTDANEQFQAAPPGGTLSNGDKTLVMPGDNFTGKIIVEGNAGSDTVTTDWSGGNFLKDIDFNGGQGTSDQFVIKGGSFTSATAGYFSPHDGNIVMDPTGADPARVLNYTGLEPVDMKGSTIDDLVFNLPATASDAFLEDDGTSGNTFSRLRSNNSTFETTTFANPTDSLTINRSNPSDTLTLNALPDFNRSLTIGNPPNPIGQLTVAGPMTFALGYALNAHVAICNFSTANSDVVATGNGSISITATRSISMVSGSSLTTASGDLVLAGNHGGASTGTFSGVLLTGATVTSTAGNVTLQGKGGDTGGNNYGVRIAGSKVTGGGAGKLVTLNGTGGSTTGVSNYGVNLTSAATITSNGGDVFIQGKGGGTGTSSGNYGVGVTSSSLVTATSAGNVIVEGNGGGGSNGSNYGVEIGSSTVTSSGGAVTVTGKAGSDNGSFNRGVDINSFGVVTAGGTGVVSVLGTGGSGTSASNAGVILLGNNAKITSSGGPVSIYASAPGLNSMALVLNNNTSVSTTSNASLTVIADTMIFTGGPGGSTIGIGSGTATLSPETNGRPINLGAGDSTAQLGLTDFELDTITAGTVLIGDANSGAISVSAAVSHPNHLTLTTGGALTINQPVTMAINKDFRATANSTIGLAAATADLAASGTGLVVLTTARNINLVSGASITSINGDVTLLANKDGVTNGNFVGIDLSAATIDTTGGRITLTGKGGNDASGSQIGVRLQNGAVVGNGTTNLITVEGTGGPSTGGGNDGVNVTVINSKLASNGGKILVTGIAGGVGASMDNAGVRVGGGGLITAAGNGNVDVYGQGGGGAGGNFNHGVYILISGSQIASAGGTTKVTGVEGTGSGSFGIMNGSTIKSGVAADLTLIANTMSITGPVSAGGNIATLRQLTNDRKIVFGGPDVVGNQLGLTDLELDQVTAGVLKLGDTNSGTLLIAANINPLLSPNIQLQSGAGIVRSAGTVECNTLELTATGSIGASGSPVEIKVATLNASSSSGNVYLHVPTKVGIGSLKAGASEVVMVGDSDLTIQGQIDAPSVVLSSGGKIVQDSGKITANSVDLHAVIDIGTALARVDIDCNVIVSECTSGNIYMAWPSKIEIGALKASQECDVVCDDDVVLAGDVNATTVRITAAGSITRNTGTISAGAIVCDSGDGIGSSTAPIVTDCDNLDADCDSGGIFIQELNGVTLGKIKSGAEVEILVGFGALVVAQPVSTSSTSGDAGSIVLTAASNLIVNAPITAQGGGVSGKGGNVQLTAGTSKSVFMNSTIDTSGSGNGQAGSVIVTAGASVELYSSIKAIGAGSGAGGTIILSAPSPANGITIGQTASIDATSASGVGGDISLLSLIGISQVSDSSITTNNGGNITLAANGITISTIGSTTISAGAGAVSLLPFTNGRPINLGGSSAGSVGLSDGELDRVSAATLKIGDANSGTITVTAAISRSISTAIELTSDGDIVISAEIDGAAGPLKLTPGAGGSVRPIASGLDATASTVSFTSGSDLIINIGGLDVDSQCDQLKIDATLELTGVDLVLTGGYSFSGSEYVTIVAASNVTGTFNGLPEGATTTFNGKTLKIHYTPTEVRLVAPPTASVMVNDGNAQRSMVTSFTVTFSEVVTFPDGLAAAFTLSRTGPGSPVGNVNLGFNQSGNSVTITFEDALFAPGTRKSLIDGRYTLTMNAAKIQGAGGFLDGDGNGTGGDNGTFLTHRLYGDANGDATVTQSDFIAFRNDFNSGPSLTFDYDGDGQVNQGDFIQFRNRFNISV